MSEVKIEKNKAGYLVKTWEEDGFIKSYILKPPRRPYRAFTKNEALYDVYTKSGQYRIDAFVSSLDLYAAYETTKKREEEEKAEKELLLFLTAENDIDKMSSLEIEKLFGQWK